MISLQPIAPLRVKFYHNGFLGSEPASCCQFAISSGVQMLPLLVSAKNNPRVQQAPAHPFSMTGAYQPLNQAIQATKM